MKAKQLNLTTSSVSHDRSGSQRMRSVTIVVQSTGTNALSATSQDKPLTSLLMEEICDSKNLNRAYKQVKANKGAPGVDGIAVSQLSSYIKQHKATLTQTLLDGSYQPQAIRGVEIPKSDGSMRQLGIPTVVDRLVQQAIAQVLEPMFDATFSASSFGFRPHRSAHQALTQAQQYVQEGRGIVVDIDLEKFFDRVNHDILMDRLAKRIQDKRLLRIIRRFLVAGMMQQGVCLQRSEGVPQGGNLSPLLANLLLDELDKELERRGHKFCRYADDCNIYVSSQTAGLRVMASIKNFLARKLRLKVNEQKSTVAPVEERKFLGYTLQADGRLMIAKNSLVTFRMKVRKITKRNRGRELAVIIKQLNMLLIGWMGYFKLTAFPSQLKQLDGWIRRRLRCYRLKQKKRSWAIAKFLIVLGVNRHNAWNTAKSSKGWWRLSSAPALHEAMNNTWFEELGLVNLLNRSVMLNALTKTAVCDNARTVV